MAPPRPRAHGAARELHHCGCAVIHQDSPLPAQRGYLVGPFVVRCLSTRENDPKKFNIPRVEAKQQQQQQNLGAEKRKGKFGVAAMVVAVAVGLRLSSRGDPERGWERGSEPRRTAQRCEETLQTSGEGSGSSLAVIRQHLPPPTPSSAALYI
ncbi:unnamed protein product [Lampetra fluviatilis]